MKYHTAMTSRVTSSFHVSIGTGLMLESIFPPTAERYDSARVIPESIDITKYTAHIINAFTLVRNILSSLTDASITDIEMLTHGKIELSNTILEEINIIYGLYENTKCKLIVYIPDYITVYKSFNNNKEVGDSTKTWYINNTLIQYQILLATY